MYRGNIMITLEEIKEFAKDNQACDTQYKVFTNALDKNDIKLAWQIVAINIRWLQVSGLKIELTDIPINIDGICMLNYPYDPYVINDGISIPYHVIPIKNCKINGKVMRYDILSDKHTPYLKSIINFKDGIRHGENKEYYHDGTLHSIRNYKNGDVDGKLKRFHPNGKTSESAIYLNDKRDGIYKRYFTNGKKEMVCSYTDGKLNGELTEHYTDGKIQTRSYYNLGRKIGDTILYNRKGEVIKYVKD